MAVNETAEQALKRQNRVLNILARRTKNQIRKELNRVTSEALNNYRISPSIDESIFIKHRENIEKIAQTNLSRAFEFGSERVLKTFVKVKWITKQQKDLIISNLKITKELYANINAGRISKFFATTTKKNILETIKKYEELTVLNAREYNWFLEDNILKIIVELKETNIWRSLLSAFAWAHSGQQKGETDSGTETTKALPLDLYKVWITRQDEKVRDTHVPMHKVKVPSDQPFMVNGYPMMYPGDMSAPVELWISCRCVKQFEVPD